MEGNLRSESEYLWRAALYLYLAETLAAALVAGGSVGVYALTLRWISVAGKANEQKG
jgi:hypothetical protein